ncbi:hypothetical protein [Vibrio rotiferianus]|uniref:hypothetical protein n=1 Tax=Vibrio rotiferianus TaxID=190895 RepID=UPI0015F6A6C0|nr:hypothetical protein [Vibrio rotiferianus]
MSTQEIGELVNSVNDLTQTVANKNKEIDDEVKQAKAEFDSFMAEARGEMSHILLSRNQIMEPEGNTAIKGFTTIGLTSFEVTKEATIYGNPSQDTDHTGNGYADDFRQNVYSGYVNKSFHILRLKWTRGLASHPARLDNNYSQGYQQGAVTTGCYLRLLSGDVEGTMIPKIDYGNGWKFYGMRRRVNNIDDAFFGDHTKLGLSSQPGGSGEMLICLFGSVSGYLPYEKNIWGVFPEFARPSDIPAS